MILSSNVFNRIKKLEKENKYNYTVLSFSSERIDLVYSNFTQEQIEKLTRYYPLLVIRDKQRTENLKKSIIDNIIYSSIKRISDEKIFLIKKYLSNITYEHFISNEKSIKKIVNSITKVITLIDLFESKFDENYLNKKNRKTLQSNKKKLNGMIESNFESAIYNSELIKEENKGISLAKKNINAILEKEGCEFLQYFFFQYYEDKTYSIQHEYNSYSKSDLFALIIMFNSQDNISLNQTTTNFYKEVLNKIEFTNLYTHDYHCQNSNKDIGYFFTHIYKKLYKSMGKNKILKLSTVFHTDYLKMLKADLDRVYETMDTRIYFERKKPHRKNLTENQLRDLVEYHFLEEHSINSVLLLEFYEKNLIIGEIKHRK